MIPPTPEASGEPLSNAEIVDLIAACEHPNVYIMRGKPAVALALRELQQRRAAALPAAQGADVAAKNTPVYERLYEAWNALSFDYDTMPEPARRAAVLGCRGELDAMLTGFEGKPFRQWCDEQIGDGLPALDARLSPPQAGEADDAHDDCVDCAACSFTGQAGPGLGDCGVCGGRGYFRKQSCINGCGEDATGGPEVNDVGPFCSGCWSLLMDGLKAQADAVPPPQGAPDGRSYDDPSTWAKGAPEASVEALLQELHTLVRGECPSLLNEDSGGDATLDARILAALQRARETGAKV